jgi:hypothetical protein
MVGIKECLEALDRVMPGVSCDHTLLYGIEAKFYSAGLSWITLCKLISKAFGLLEMEQVLREV